ncbi:MAG: universal stress protein [Balneolaceae bacterium]|nr:universal stress protein [Balneolaceae bacterium]
MNINTVLFPTDFSDNAEKALPYALEICKRADARLSIMHSADRPFDYGSDDEEAHKSHTQNLHRMMDRLVEEIKQEKKNRPLQVKTVLESGNTVSSILGQVTQLDADLIVMGTKGASGVKKVLYGSNTTDLILKSKVPVLAIPENVSYHGIEHITFTTDFHDRDLEALGDTVQLATLFDAATTVLHVDMNNDFLTDIKFRGFRDLAAEELGDEKLEFQRVYEFSYYAGIADYLTDHTTSLLVMVRYKKPFFDSLLKMDHTKQMGFSTKIPLLVLPGEAYKDQ